MLFLACNVFKIFKFINPFPFIICLIFQNEVIEVFTTTHPNQPSDSFDKIKHLLKYCRTLNGLPVLLKIKEVLISRPKIFNF